MAGPDLIKITNRFDRKLLVCSAVAFPLLYPGTWRGRDACHIKTLATVSGPNAKVPVSQGFHDELLVIAVVVVKLPDGTTIVLAGEPVNVDVQYLLAMASLNNIGPCSSESTPSNGA